MALLRPRATAHGDSLVLRNIASDTHLPLAGIEAVMVRTTLNVWVNEERYVCVGIGRPTRKLVDQKGQGPMSILGLEHDDRRYGFGQSKDIGRGKDYAGFVEDRIAALALAARREPHGPPPPIRRRPALPELIALGLLLGALIVTFLL
jgi:hypothetical protein